MIATLLLSSILQGSLSTTAAETTPAVSSGAYSGFPAVSKDGLSVVVIDTEYRDGYENHGPRTGVFTVLSSKTGKILNQVDLLFSRSADQKPDTTWQKKLETAQDWLKNGSYRSLKKLETQHQQGAAFYHVYKRPELSVFEAKKLLFKTNLPNENSKDPACTQNCTVVRTPQLDNAWLEDTQRILVVEYGFYEGRDGQEKGPDYLVFKY